MRQQVEQSATASEAESHPAAERARRGLAPPSIPAVVFILLACVIPFGLQQPLLNADGDLARHLRHGRWMLEHGELIRHDPFSFTRPGAPFLGFEYGSQLVYALAERVGGLPGVAILAGLLVATAYALLARFLLRRGVDPLLAYLTTMAATVLGAGHWLARPHLFSLVLTLLLLELLESRGRPRYWLYAALFLVWANLHGGFVLGYIMIGVYVTGSTLEYVSSRSAADRARAQHLGTALVVAIGATLVNPHGIELHRHVVQFLGQSYIMDNTAEFASPDFHEPDARLFLFILLASLAALICSERRPSWPRLLLVLAMTAFALTAVRNISLFGLLALPLVALHLDPDWRRIPYARGLRGRFNSTAARTVTWPWLFGAILLLAGVAATRGRVGSVTLIRDAFDPETFPVAAVAKGRQAGLRGHLFSEYAWGGYLVYAWPEQRIFIDGGTDFFGPELFEEYSTIKQMRPGWRKLLEKWEISLALLRRNGALTHELVRDPRWSVWYCDSLSVFARRSNQPNAVTSTLRADSAEAALEACSSTQARAATPANERPQGSRR